jgi:hypothetical protein
MAVKPTSTSSTELVLPQLQIQDIQLTIIGDTPLITHAWSQKAKLEMLQKQMKSATPAKAAKDPEQDFLDSLYQLEGGGFGFPSVGLKAAAVTACTSVGGLTKVQARQAFHVVGEPALLRAAWNGSLMRADMVRIQGSDPQLREDMVRVGMGTADLRYRGQFYPWFVQFVVRYNARVFSAEQIANLFNTAGFAVGVGEWRPEKDGSYGRFRLANAAELKAIQEGNFLDLYPSDMRNAA